MQNFGGKMWKPKKEVRGYFMPWKLGKYTLNIEFDRRVIKG
jgi:hypothetical protein